MKEKVEGSSCQVEDGDQDSCNDCLWLNCTAAVSSALGTVFVSFRSRFLPCYSYNASEDIDIHACNSSVFAGTDVFLASVFAERTASTVVTVELGGFLGTYVTQFILEQFGHGIRFGVSSLSLYTLKCQWFIESVLCRFVHAYLSVCHAILL